MLRDPISVRVAYARRVARERARIARWQIESRTVGSDEPPARPIFIIGCPRSGTSLLFALLARHEALRALPREGHVLWNAYQHPRLKGWSSDRATQDDIRPNEARYLYTAVRAIAGKARFLDKTPKNVLRIPYLARLFPDASLVFLKRDGRATVNSLVVGWTSRRGLSYKLPQRLSLAEYRGRFWSYVLPPGWREMARSSLVEVAGSQYVVSNETAIRDIRELAGGLRWIELAYEDLVRDPLRHAGELLGRLELPKSEAVLDMASTLGSHHVGALSPPRRDKWLDRNDEILEVLPKIAPTMTRLGYGSPDRVS